MTDVEKIITYNKKFEYGERPNIVTLGEFERFPNPLSGKMRTYMDMLKQELTVQNIPELRYYPWQFYDFQSLFFQKSYFIESLLKQNPTVEEVYRLLRNSVDVTKGQSSLNNIAVRNSLKNRYATDFHEKNKSIHDIFKTEAGTIVLRSTLSNDISYKIQENVISVLGYRGRKHAVAVIQERKDEIISEIIEDITRTYHLIYALNPNAFILEIGITLPKLFQILGNGKNMKVINRCLSDLIDALQYRCKQEDVAYIKGTTVESNCLLHGQKVLYNEITHALAEKLENPIVHLEQCDFENKGLYGMMKQEDMLQLAYAKSYISGYNNSDCNRILEMTLEHKNAFDCYQKTLR